MVVFEFTKFGKHCVLYSETIFYYNHRGQGEGFGYANPIFVDGDDNENMSDDSMQSNVYCFGGNWCTLYPAGMYFVFFFFHFFHLSEVFIDIKNC